jgi:hypothetical protein
MGVIPNDFDLIYCGFFCKCHRLSPVDGWTVCLKNPLEVIKLL